MIKLEILRADVYGFCFGVKRALRITETTLAKTSYPVYTLGQLIHNPQVVKYLVEKGVKSVNSLNEIKGEGNLIIRSHGLSPAIVAEARSKGLNIVDATCPFVKKEQKLAEKLSLEGYQVIIVGEEFHPEVKGILGYVPSAWIATSPSEVASLPFKYKMGVVVQTTQPKRLFMEILKELAGKCKELRAFNTICNATERRQASALALAEKVEVMLVIGGKNSGNTTRLVQLCKEVQRATYHIESKEELLPEFFKGVKKVGITAGASTPQWVVEEVIQKLKELQVV